MKKVAYDDSVYNYNSKASIQVTVCEQVQILLCSLLINFLSVVTQ